MNEKAFCYHPFGQMLLQPNGTATPCCWNQSFTYGSLANQNMKEIWNGEKARALRQEFLSGRPTSCAQQMKHLGCHKTSHRDYKNLLELKEEQTHGPRRLDLRLNSKCNLECIMCNVWKGPNGFYEGTDFWTSGPTELFPFLHEVNLLGGEPFVQADTFRLIDLVSKASPKCTWAFVTNGQYKFNDRMRSTLDAIPIRWIQVSLDSINPQTYSSIRKKGRLDRALETLQAIRTYRDQKSLEKRGFRLYISMCVQKLNWKEMAEFAEFALKNDLLLIYQFAYEPENLSLLDCSPEVRAQITWWILENVAPITGAAPVRPILQALQESFRQQVAEAL